MRGLKCYLYLFLGILLNPAFAAPSVLLLTDEPHEIVRTALIPYTGFTEDTEGLLSIADVLSSNREFTSQPGDFVNFGLSQSHHWLRFTVINQTQDKHRYLEIGGSLSREVNVFAKENNAYVKQEKMRWSITNRYHLVFEPAKETTIYIQVHDRQGVVIISPLLYNSATAIDSISYQHVFYAFLMSGLLVLAAYNFLNYFLLRDTAFLTTSMFITAVALTIGNNEGLLSFFPWIDNNFGWLSVTFIFAVIISGLRLAMSLLDVRQRLPGMIVYYDLGSIFGLILMIAALIHGYGLLLGGILGVCDIALILFTIVKLIKNNYTLEKNLVIAVLIFLLASLPILLIIIGAIDYYPAVINQFFIATLIALFIASFSQAEKTRLKNASLERTAAANDAKDEFITTMSHELRTPMNAVVGAGRLLALAPLSKEQTEYVTRLNHSSAHMLSLVNDLLDLARVDHQLLQLDKVPFKLEETLNTLKQFLNESATQKQLALTLNNHFLPINKQLVGDPRRLNQVLLNLLGNAIKFTDSGQVSLTITPVEVNPSHARLHFEVNDTGIGLTKAQQYRLFQPFSQAENSTNRLYGGTGLGLAISQKLVQRMGGDLTISSVHEQGSCFSFTLNFPLAMSNLKPEKVNAISQKNLLEYRVLLVDDDEMNRFFGQKLLEACGVEVATAESGEAALQAMQQQVFDLVFMDISMPNVDGYESTRRIRLLPELNNVVIVALTAHSVAGEKERCLSAGMDDHLMKPFELDDLQNIIVKWLLKSDKNKQLN